MADKKVIVWSWIDDCTGCSPSVVLSLTVDVIFCLLVRRIVFFPHMEEHFLFDLCEERDEGGMRGRRRWQE
jgi:hypothetical protein